MAFRPGSATVEQASLVHAHGDQLAARSGKEHVEHFPHQDGLVLKDLQAPPLAIGYHLVSEWDRAAVPETVPGILEHGASSVAGHLPAVVLVHDLEDRFREPTLVGFIVNVDRDINHLGAATLEQLFMTGGVEFIPGKAAGIPDDEIVDVVSLAELDGVLEGGPVCCSTGDTIVAEYSQNSGAQLGGFLLGLLDLAVDRNALIGLATGTDPGVDDRGLFLIHVLILFVIDDVAYATWFEFFT
nr:hypothetical protein [Pseudogulbenkiania ferrooxidans]